MLALTGVRMLGHTEAMRLRGHFLGTSSYA